VRIVFHDQQHGVAGADVSAIVLDAHLLLSCGNCREECLRIG